MIAAFNSGLARLVGSFLYPFIYLGPWVGMIVVSLLTALVMLVVYRLASDQDAIRLVKNRIVAHLLELRLYKNSLPVTLRAQRSILSYNFRYLLQSARPMLVMLVPLVLAIIHIDVWYGHGPLKPGGSTIVKVRLKEGYQASRVDIALVPAPGLVVETPALRIDSEGEVDWRVRATEPGFHRLLLVVNREAVSKPVVVGVHGPVRLSPVRVGPFWLDQLLNPGEAPLPAASPVESIEVGYPPRRMVLLGWRFHWLVAYVGLSLLFGFAFKGTLRVEI